MTRAATIGLALALVAASVFAGQPREKPWPFVIDEVDHACVIHDGDGIPAIYFWSRVQKMPTLLAKEYGTRDKFCIWWANDKQAWCIYFRDYPDGCDRLVYAKEWSETWPKKPKDGEERDKPWWAMAQPIGLKQPKKSHWSIEK